MADAFLKLVNGGAKFNRAKFDTSLNKRQQESEDDLLRKQHLEDKAAKSKAAAIRKQFDFFQQGSTAAAESSSEEEQEEDDDTLDDFASDVEDEDDEDGEADAKRVRGADGKILKGSITLKELQRKYEISVKGFDVPRLQDTFSGIEANTHIPKYLFRNILSRVEDGGFGFNKPTPVQMQSIPTLMSGRELQVYAPTGSGKTIAFALPMLAMLDSPPKEGEYSGFIDTHLHEKKTETPAGKTKGGKESKDTKGSKDNKGKNTAVAAGKDAAGKGGNKDKTAPSKSDKPAKNAKGKHDILNEDSDAEDETPVASSEAAHKSDLNPNKPVNVLPFRGIVLAPTRELAHQTFKVLKNLSKGRDWRIVMLTKEAQRKVKKTMTTIGEQDDEGEVEVDPSDELDQDALFHGQKGDDLYQRYGIHNGDMHDAANNDIMYRNIIVTTPMILLMLLLKSNAIMPLVRMVVFDEADRLFDMGFIEQIDRIINRCVNPRLLKVLCSATVTEGVETLAKKILRDPVRVVVGGRNVAQSMVVQRLVYVGNEDGKPLAIRQQIQKGLNVPMLIFTQSKERAMQLYDELKFEPIRPAVIHSDMKANERINVMNDFRSGKVWVLICTDLMARGIDFKHVNCVINYDFPQSVASYIHRIGRTGRAGRKGEAVTFVTDDDKVLLHEIAHIVRDSAIAQEFGYNALKDKNSITSDAIEVNCPSWMLELPKSTAGAIKKLAENAPKRQNINMDNKQKRREEKAIKRQKLGKIQRSSGIVSRGETGTARLIPQKKTEEEAKEKKERKRKRTQKNRRAKEYAKKSRKQQDYDE